MIIGIHQPNYLPYLGFFDKMNKCDTFVIYDSAQFNKDNFHHRNRIRIFHGAKWLTVPVYKKHVSINNIYVKNDIKINNMKWSDYHFNEISSAYRKAPFFSNYGDDIKDIYGSNYEKLLDLNMELIYSLMKYFKINTKIVFSSELGINSKSTQALVDIVNTLDGDTYLSGPSGRHYLDLDLFKDLNVEFQEYTHPTYEQGYSNFIPNMSAIDALFNVGSTAVK